MVLWDISEKKSVQKSYLPSTENSKSKDEIQRAGLERKVRARIENQW